MENYFVLLHMMLERRLKTTAYVCEMYYRKLIEIIGVEYYDKTKYFLFKCDWTDTTRDIGYKVDECELVLINFKNLVHSGELITNEPHVLTTQVDQVCYVEDESDPDWACAVRTKPRNVYNVGNGEGPHNACANYHECQSLLLTNSNEQDPQDDFSHVRLDVDLIQAYVNH